MVTCMNRGGVILLMMMMMTTNWSHLHCWNEPAGDECIISTIVITIVTTTLTHHVLIMNEHNGCHDLNQLVTMRHVVMLMMMMI